MKPSFANTDHESAIKDHMIQKHPGDAIPSVAQIHGQIAQYTPLATA